MTMEHDILGSYDKVFLIEIGHKGAGLFAYVHHALNQIIYCEENNYLPVVNYDESWGNLFFDPAHGDNMWDYYFEPVAGYMYADICRMIEDSADALTEADLLRIGGRKLRRILYWNPAGIFHYPFGHWRKHPPEDIDEWSRVQRERGARYIAKYVHVKPNILEKVDAYCDAVMKGHYVIGVHMRGTDIYYANKLLPEDYTATLDELLSQEPSAKVFVATDQQQYLEFVRSRYGDRVIWQNCIRSTDSRNPHDLPKRDPVAQGAQVVVDCLLLSRCNLVVKGPGAIPEFAHYFNPELRSIDLGIGNRQIGFFQGMYATAKMYSAWWARR